MKLPAYIPTTVVKLDRERRIALTLAAMRRITAVTGASVFDSTDLRETIGQCIWAMLIDDDRGDVTVENIEDMIYPGNMAEVIAAFNEVIAASNPEGKAVAVPVEESPQV